MPYKPAREIKPKAKGYRGKEPFLTTGEYIHWESFLERNYIRLADFDQTVQEIYYQPICIYYWLNGKKYRYYPDFKVVFEDNRVCLIEVKPERFIKSERNVIKYAAAQQYCKEMGWSFEIFTERQINPNLLQWNLSLLRHLGTQEVSEEEEDCIFNVMEKKQELHLFELREHCESMTEEAFYSTVYRLIYLQELQTDLVNIKLSDDSLLRLN
ncbi:TnsA endonuclease N-terminal domain-containing protein [Paenibacillus aurantiacus]|uniref:TnsA endonuclease N-terminal domain-containing protein n=1 Tax=Paenibacillus aurantiacus TaxID=1936118 RepID=A0ABV5KSG2_9BACL